MPNLWYNNWRIVVLASFDEITNSWFPIADVHWESDGHHETHTINGPMYYFDTWQDPEEHIVQFAKEWIHNIPHEPDR